MTRLTAEQQAVIEGLQEYLTRIAHNLVHAYFHEQDPEDLLSLMNVYIVERAGADPTFLEQKPGYVSRAAAWAARDYARRECYGRNLQPQLLDRKADNGELLAEKIAAPPVDFDLPIDVRNALATLDAKRRQIAMMLVAGFQRKEIAEHFGVQSPSLSWDFEVIRRALTPVRAAM